MFGGCTVGVSAQSTSTRRAIVTRLILQSVLALPALSVALATPAPVEPPRPTGILVLDNCDPLFKGKDLYRDNPPLLDPAGRRTFRASGFNNCEAIGSAHAVAADPARGC